MKSRYTAVFSLLTASALTLGACSRTDVAKQNTDDARMGAGDTAAARASQGSQVPGGDAAFQQAQQPMTASGGVIEDNKAHPIDPTALPTPSNSSQLPRPDLTQGGAQSGSLASEGPITLPPGRGQGSQIPGGQPPSQTPVGGESGNDTRRNSVVTALAGKPEFANVKVSIGSDGCVTLDGSVKTAEKKEEAAAIARGSSGMSCVVNRLAVR
jgi:hypothetical protein